MLQSARECAFLTVLGMFFTIFGPSVSAAVANPEEIAENQPQAARSEERTSAVLGISWMPGFCEKRPKTPECSRQRADSPDARQFSLSGIWHMRKTYCGVEAGLREQDKKREWLSLPELSLSVGLRLQLAEAMPGVASGFDRHQWVKYGTCSGMVAEDHYGRALRMLAVINGSAVRQLFESNLGGTISEEEVKAAFDAAFGAGAGSRVRMRCSKDGDRRVITGLTIGLGGSQSEDLPTLIAAARETKFGCKEGVVDEAGLQ